MDNTTGSARTVVVSGGTDGMGRALALARAARGDRVIAIGSNGQKGERLLRETPTHAQAGTLTFLRAELTTVRGADAVVRAVLDDTARVDALALFANRQAPKRTETAEGLESTFALYYLSRHILSHGLTPALNRAGTPVIINVAGVGITKGRVHWDDLQLADDYSMIAAQLQAGRANDLLGVHYAAIHGDAVPYVLYHPGFTQSGDLTPLPAAMRAAIRAAARLGARPIEESIAPIHDFIDAPPTTALTARDRDTLLPLTLPTLEPGNAQRLATATEQLLEQVRSA
jgi:NAD(P)-dependent dehydrogenase (short-subunit alcohol dehydrogenase family)